MGTLHTFGLVYNGFLKSLGAETSALTIITGTYFSGLSFAGLFASTLFKKYPMRSVGLFGAVIYMIGNFLTIFATSVQWMVISFGVLQGNNFRLEM